MSVEKMMLVNIAGLSKDLDNVLTKCSDSGYFHIEKAEQGIESARLYKYDSINPYTNSLKKLAHLCVSLGVKGEKVDYSDIEMSYVDEFDMYINTINDKFVKLDSEKQSTLKSISNKEQALKHLNHLQGIDSDFEMIKACDYIKVRFGKLPIDSYNKLSYYKNNAFYFQPLDSDNTYYWGVYFASANKINEIDDIFTSIYFEHIELPDFLKGTPEVANTEIIKEIDELKKRLLDIDIQIKQMHDENNVEMKKVYAKLKNKNDRFDLRSKVAIVNEKFLVTGFIPKVNVRKFEELFSEIESVSIIFKKPDSDDIMPPTKLKNGFLTRPFTSLVEIYGLPTYNDINPTSFVAITYTLFFGLMFGDLGQGLILVLIGLFLSIKKGIQAGGIITRVGLSSMLFGTLYGSVFGFEHVLDPLYKLIGFSKKPFETFERTNEILLGAVAIGIVIIIISIITNIITGIKQKDYERALLGSNGLSGLIFYCSIVAGVALQLLMNIKIMSPIYIAIFIVIPLISMFFKKPIVYFAKHKKFRLSEDGEESIGEFITENFFELFESVLSYVTNTVSFLRIGGFILSHAGMMLVVMTLADMSHVGVAPFVIIIGNLFVMGMEGMLVGIQAIRLEFYEMFSRFYEGNGKPFVPVGFDYSTEID